MSLFLMVIAVSVTFVRLTVRLNDNPDLRITDFNTDWAKENYRPDNDVDSVIYMANGQTYIYSDAASPYGRCQPLVKTVHSA